MNSPSRLHFTKLVSLAVLVSVPNQPAAARLVGQWVIGSGQGTVEYSIYNDNTDKTYFIISDASDGVSGEVEVYLSIGGKSPKPQSTVQIQVGPNRVDFMADEGGSISTACRVCAANFDALWQMMRAGKVMQVRFDGRAATFSLSGSSRVLGSEPPVADFYR